jgi:hypothetical protein
MGSQKSTQNLIDLAFLRALTAICPTLAPSSCSPHAHTPERLERRRKKR